MRLRALPLAAVLAMAATQLGGCVAAAALVPLAAGGTMVGKRAGGTKGTAGQTAAAPGAPVGEVAVGEVTVGRGVAVPPPDIAPPVEDEPEQSGPVDPPALSAAAILPQAEVRDDGYAAMTAFVLAAAEAPKGKKERRSALLDQKSLAGVPRMTDCAGQRGALLVDLDPGEKPFDLTDPPAPAPGLADRLRAIRGTGTAVVWIATLPESASRDLANLLAATGLDPLGIDGMLLLRGRETRKQELLNRAGEDWCVLAIAGDRKADFDEVFDYLRNPDGPVALALEQHIGAGWFLVPPPIR